jgi:hypothetical protein
MGVQGAAPGQDRDPAALVQDGGGAAQRLVGRQPGATGDDVGGVARHVALRTVPSRYRHLLHVHRQRDVGDAAVLQRRPTGQVGDVLDVGRAHHARVVLGHVDEQAVELHVLLGVGVDEVVVRHARDGQHRLAVELGVVQAVEQVDATRTGRGQAHPEAPRELRVRARHEGGRLLVADLHEPDPVTARAQGLHDRVDPVAR